MKRPQASPAHSKLHVPSPQSDSPDTALDLSLRPFPPKPEVTVANRRLWEFWPGNNRFYLHGRLMLGPCVEIKWTLLTVVVLVGLSAAYFVFVLPYLWKDVNAGLPVANIVLFICALGSMGLCMCVEPGIIPRKCVFELGGYVPEEFTTNILVKDMERGAQYKYCSTCQVFRPPNAHHCNTCGNCVEVFDHHCPFLNNCIGKRNYRYFLAFIASAVSVGLSEIAGLFLFLLYDPNNQTSVIDADIVKWIVVALLIATCLVTLFVTILCCFHVDLCLSGETTKERLKHTHDPKKEKSCFRPYPSWFSPLQMLTLQQVMKAETWRETEVRS